MQDWVGSTAGAQAYQHLLRRGIKVSHRLSLCQANVMVGRVPEEVLVLDVVLGGCHKAR